MKKFLKKAAEIDRKCSVAINGSKRRVRILRILAVMIVFTATILFLPGGTETVCPPANEETLTGTSVVLAETEAFASRVQATGKTEPVSLNEENAEDDWVVNPPTDCLGEIPAEDEPEIGEVRIGDGYRDIYIGKFRLTGYCPCEKCCGQWADGYTATMTVATAKRTIAVDPDEIPLGTHVVIDDHEYIAEDTGSAINGKKIDVFCDTHEECYSEFCNGTHGVWVRIYD